MAGIVIEPLMISTYARFIISQCTALAESVELVSLPVEKLKRIASGDEQLKLDGPLKPESIAMALAGPAHQIFLDALHALARVMQTRLEVHLAKEEIFVREETEVNPNEIDQKLLDKATVVECDSLMQRIDSQAGETFDQYQEMLHTGSQQLIEMINAEITQLNDNETYELMFQESIEDLAARFNDLKIEWPKMNYKKISMNDYLALKAYMAVFTALGRQQNSRQQSDGQTFQNHSKAH